MLPLVLVLSQKFKSFNLKVKHMIITVHGTGIELTDAIREYIEEKVGALKKFLDADRVTKVEVDVGMRSQHHQKGKIFYAEMNLSHQGGMIRVEKDAEDLYKAIDKVKDHLKVELESLKEKRLSRDKKTIRENKGYSI